MAALTISQEEGELGSQSLGCQPDCSPAVLGDGDFNFVTLTHFQSFENINWAACERT